MERPSELISEKKSSKEYTEDLIREYLKGTMKRKGALKGAPGRQDPDAYAAASASSASGSQEVTTRSVPV